MSIRSYDFTISNYACMNNVLLRQMANEAAIHDTIGMSCDPKIRSRGATGKQSDDSSKPILHYAYAWHICKKPFRSFMWFPHQATHECHNQRHICVNDMRISEKKLIQQHAVCMSQRDTHTHTHELRRVHTHKRTDRR